MKDREKLLLGAGIAGLGVLIFMSRKTLSAVATSALDAVNDAIFLASIPSSARTYADVIRQVAQESGVDPFVIVSLGWRESHWGDLLSPRGPSGLGDAGHGHGLMQIDDRTWGDWLAEYDWTDPYTNVSKGADIFSGYLSNAYGQGLDGDAALLAAMGAYNHGPKAIGNVVAAVRDGTDIFAAADTNTTQGNYASDVYAKAQSWQGVFASNLGTSGEEQA